MINTNEMTQHDKEEQKTLVWWDISSCPIPDGFDPRLVGRRIESAVKNSGYSGPLTITAIGDLRKTPGDKVLRELSSTGIALRHAHGIRSALNEWTNRDTSPATIMLISSASQLESLAIALYRLAKRGNRILLAYPQPHPAPGLLWPGLVRGVSKVWLWKNLLEDEVDAGTADNKLETARLVLPDLCPPSYCSLCRLAFHSIEDFTTHLNSVEHTYVEWACNACETHVDRFEAKKPPPPNDDPETIEVWDLLYDADLLAYRFGKMLSPGRLIYPPSNINVSTIVESLSKEKCHKDEMIMDNEVRQHGEEEEGTLVLWDINNCPIPDGFDPRLVGRRIESALKNSGYSNGPLTIIAIGDLSNIGDNVLRGLSSSGIALKHSHGIQSALYGWTRRNTSPATIMLISGASKLECLARTLYDLRGYRILLAYPQRDPTLDLLSKSFLRHVSKVWLWKNLLEDEVDSGTADNNQETTRLVLPGESPLYCSECRFAAQSIEDLTTHLKSVKHAFSWDRQASRHGVNRFEVKPPPPNDDPETIKVWDLLHDADLLSRRFVCVLGPGPFIHPGNIDVSTIVTSLSKEKCRKDEMMMHNEVTQYKKKESNEVMTQYKEKKKTLVLWHIDSCPVPDGYDPRLVGPRIESALKKSGYPGPLTIIAIGDLRQIHGENVLRELSSTGIALKHAHEVQTDLEALTRCYPPPATVMLISGPRQLECLAPALYDLDDNEFTILLAYPQRDPAPDWLWKSFLSGVQKEWLWKSLLEGEVDSGTVDEKQETTILALHDELPAWSCSLCRLGGQSFEDLTTHLKSEEHAHSENVKKSKTEEEDHHCRVVLAQRDK